MPYRLSAEQTFCNFSYVFEDADKLKFCVICDLDDDFYMLIT